MGHTEFELDKLAETVRKQGYAEETGGTSNDLVFDESTGEFVQRSKLSSLMGGKQDGMTTATNMTEEGFA